jgi:hypothetical protein
MDYLKLYCHRTIRAGRVNDLQNNVNELYQKAMIEKRTNRAEALKNRLNKIADYKATDFHQVLSGCLVLSQLDTSDVDAVVFPGINFHRGLTHYCTPEQIRCASEKISQELERKDQVE